MELTVERALSESRKLSRWGKLTAAEKVLAMALRSYPRNARLRRAQIALDDVEAPSLSPTQLAERGEAWLRNGCTKRARICYQAALARAPGFLAAELGLAHVERAEGQTDAAIARYSSIIRRAPTLADPYRYISDMRKTEEGDGWVETLTNALRIATADNARIALSFALGKALSDLGAVDAAFSSYSLGNGLRHLQLDMAPKRRLGELLAITETFEGAVPDAPLPLKPWGDNPRPIFILGLPRTGSTLVERILARHPAIAAGGERNDLTDAIMRSGKSIEWPDATRANAIRDAYKLAMPTSAPGTQFVTDKMPSNARWIGYIKRVFPEALIIETLRDPRAVGWSLYRKCFTGSEQLAYAYDLAHIAAYTTLHQNMMAMWQSQFVGAIRQLRYEALTETPDREIRALLADLGLGFNPACLSPEEGDTSVRTASFEQVRTPIYTGSSDNWRAYGRYLGPLMGLHP